MPIRKLKTCASFIAMAVMGFGAAHAGETGSGDWWQWGNTPDRNMIHATATNLVEEWSPGVKKDDGSEQFDLTKSKNVKWIAKIGSQCYGNPVVFKKKVLIGTNNTSPRDPKNTVGSHGPQDNGDRGVVMCFNEDDGSFIWQLASPKLKSGKVNDWEFLGCCSSPTIDPSTGYVYVVTNRCELLCLDLNGMANGNDGPFKNEGQYKIDPDKLKGKGLEDFKDLEVLPTDADIIWRLDMMDDLGVFPHNASNCSVIIEGDKVLLCTSNGVDWGHVNVPSAQAPSFIAVHKKTGEILWEDELGLANGARKDCGLTRAIFHGQWSSPSVGEVNGKKHVYFGGGDGFLYALDVEDGKTVWKADCVLPIHKKNAKGYIAYPDAKGPSEINSTPVFYKNRVYVPTGQDPEHGEGVGVLTCLDATKTGDITDTGKIWTYDKINRSISTVSIYNGLLFIADFSGYVHCLDPETGAVHWVHNTGAHMWSSTFVADGKVYFGTEDGDAWILKADKELKVIGKVNVDAPIYGTPMVANGVMYIASQTHLFAVQKK
jgi:outer membrane protein assembly factor BamB